MDDIRRPQRRDYALPSHRPAMPSTPQPHTSPHQPHHQPLPTPNPPHPSHQHQSPQPQYTPQPTHHQSQPAPLQPAAHPTYHHSQPKPAKHRKIRLFSGKKLTIIIGALLAAAAIFGAGYLLRPSNSGANGIPQSITRQVNYSLYFPSPMPPGYSYMKNTATFQIGQVYYKFASGKKRVTVTEQPMPSQKPDLSLYQGYIKFDSPVGEAVVGTNLGEAQAIVLTPTTVITMNTVGGVSTDDLHTAINDLRNIGQNPQKS